MRNRSSFAAGVTALCLLSAAPPLAAQAPPEVLVNLSAEGGMPEAKLLKASDGNLYGTTCAGGIYGQGSVFKVDAVRHFATVVSFAGSDGECPAAELIQGSDGYLYGTTSSGGSNFFGAAGTIFRISTLPGGGMETLHVFQWNDPADGAYPFAGLIEAGAGLFYGTTEGGGAHGDGTVFMMDMNANPISVTVLHHFDGSVSGEGRFPTASLVEDNGVLYGTTLFGGTSDFGTIFSIDTGGFSFTTIHDFGGGYAAYPYAALVKVGDYFYGTTQQLCSSQGNVLLGCGTVFKTDATGADFQPVYFFRDGFMSPVAPLLLGSDGALYGTAQAGGAHGDGAIFRLDISTDVATASVVHDFDKSTTGSFAKAGLIEDGGFLYTTASADGPGGAGTIVKVPLTGAPTALVVHSFGPILPNQSSSELTPLNGSFYGTSARGGLHNGGTVFRDRRARHARRSA